MIYGAIALPHNGPRFGNVARRQGRFSGWPPGIGIAGCIA